MNKIKIFKPTTPSQRHLIQLDKKDLLAKKPKLKASLIGNKTTSGRNHHGKITVRHKGGGHKKCYRKINFKRYSNTEGIICSIEYDPFRTSFIASVYDLTINKFYYIIAPKNLFIGDIIKSGLIAEHKIGHCLPLSEIPTGSFIHNVSSKKSKPAEISRSAGTYSILTEKTFNSARIKLSSGEERFVSVDCIATIGIVSNENLFIEKLGKAGRARWLNKRPSVRGVAMNPIDHPHGGGEGKKSGKGITPWGKPVRKGRTTNTNNKLIIKKK